MKNKIISGAVAGLLLAGVSFGSASATGTPTGDPQWCSPGFWRNNPIAMAETGIDPGYKVWGQDTFTFAQVLANPGQHARTGLYNRAADILSKLHPKVNFTGVRVADSCPLAADASRKQT